MSAFGEKWYSRAAAQGYEPSQNRKMVVFNLMTAKQKDEAKRSTEKPKEFQKNKRWWHKLPWSNQ